MPGNPVALSTIFSMLLFMLEIYSIHLVLCRMLKLFLNSAQEPISVSLDDGCGT